MIRIFRRSIPWTLILFAGAIATAACGSDPAAGPGGDAQAADGGDATVPLDGDAAGDAGGSVDGAADGTVDGTADTEPADTGPIDTGLTAPPWTPDRPCNTGGGALPEGVQELAWDDGVAQSHVSCRGSQRRPARSRGWRTRTARCA